MTLRTRLLLATLRSMVVVTGVVPRRVAEPFCRLAGIAWWAGAPGQRAAVRANLRQVLGREPRTSLVQAVFQHGALSYWDTFALPHLSRAEHVGLVQAEGWEHIDAGLAAGRGVVLVGAHLGSLSLVASSVAARGYPVTAVVEPIQPPELLEFFAAQRGSPGMRVVPAGQASVRVLLSALRGNEVIGLISDRDIMGTGPRIPFFGAPTNFPDGAAALAVRTGAALLSAVAVRRPDGTFQGWIRPVAVRRTGDSRVDVAEMTRAIARRLEYHIGTNAEQWTVFQRRWPDV